MWYSKKTSQFQPFGSLEDFISVVEQTVYQNPKTRNLSGTWLKDFLRAYEQQYGVYLKVQRWVGIEEKYNKKSKSRLSE